MLLAEFHANRAIVRLGIEGALASSLEDFAAAEAIPAAREHSGYEARFLLGHGTALVRAGRVEEGLDRWRRSLELRPESVTGRQRVGEYLLSAGDAGGALPHLEAAARQEAPGTPTGRTVRLDLAIAAIETGRFDLGAAALSEVSEPWRVAMEDFEWRFAEWGARFLAALARLAGHLRLAEDSSPLRARIQAELGVQSRGGMEGAARFFREKKFDEAIVCARCGLLAQAGLDAPDLGVELNLHGVLGMARYYQGEDAEAAPALEDSRRVNPANTAELRLRKGADTFFLAVCRARLGAGRVEVLALLGESVDLGFKRPDWMAGQPAFAPLAEDPDFLAILERARR